MNSSVINFLTALKSNNNRDWFQENRDQYESARSQVVDFLDSVFIPQIVLFDGAIAGLSAKQCLFRIYRDVRFSKDKTPYKTYFGSYVAPGGRKSLFSGYYLHLEPDNCFIAGGAYCPKGVYLKNIRQEIYYNYDEFTSLIQSVDFKATFGEIVGEKLKRPPVGFPKDFEGIEFLKLKDFTVFHRFEKELLDHAAFADQMISICKKMKPLNDFFNRAIDV